ncbi:MAG: hypothetical protein R3E09_02385 [Novosphingobium sp.]
MAPNTRIRERTPEEEAHDPREQQGAEVIDLATRAVLPRSASASAATRWG